MTANQRRQSSRHSLAELNQKSKIPRAPPQPASITRSTNFTHRKDRHVNSNTRENSQPQSLRAYPPLVKFKHTFPPPQATAPEQFSSTHSSSMQAVPHTTHSSLVSSSRPILPRFPGGKHGTCTKYTWLVFGGAVPSWEDPSLPLRQGDKLGRLDYIRPGLLSYRCVVTGNGALARANGYVVGGLGCVFVGSRKCMGECKARIVRYAAFIGTVL